MALYRAPNRRLSEPPQRNRCIVLDLDETLVHTQDSTTTLFELGLLSDPQLMNLRSRLYYMTLEDLFKQPGTGTHNDYWGVMRPHLREFLEFCTSYFQVTAVWSAGQRSYVQAIVDNIFRGLPRPPIVFSYDDCRRQGKVLDKPLQMMMDRSPELSRYMRLDNTLVVDDRAYTFAENPDNGILIPAYNPGPDLASLYQEDQGLLELRNWLISPEVLKAPDVRLLDKRAIFCLPTK